MKKILTGLLALIQAVAPIAYAQTAPAPVSGADMQSLQNTGKALANATASQSGTFNADGSLVQSASGSYTTAKSSQSIASQGTYLQSLTGVTGYNETANPGRGNTAGAQVSTNHYAEYSCATELGAKKTIGSRAVVLNSCAGSIAAVQGVSVSICTALSVGGSCDKATHPESFTDYSAQVNAWTQIDDGNLGLACTASGVCRITIQGTVTAKGNGDTMAQDAMSKSAADHGNSLTADVEKIGNSRTADQQATAKAAQDCALLNQDRLAQGLSPITCDGQKEVGITKVDAAAGNSTTVPSSCTSDSMTCLREATQTVTYTRSCTRSFGLTEYTVPWTIPTKVCTLTKTVPVATPGQTTVPAPTVTNSCTADDLAGGTKVASTEGSCTAGSDCDPNTWTESYVFPDKGTAGEGTVYPTAMSGSPAASCSNKGQGTLGGCGEGGWFARTLSDSECYVSSTTTNADGTTSVSTSALTYAQKAGCGYCAKPLFTDTCYAQASASAPADTCDAMPAGCQLTNSKPLSSVSGITTSQEETYTCTKQETSCVQYQKPAGCTTNLAQGLDTAQAPVADQSQFNDAAASMALLAAIDKSANGGTPYEAPKIFNGDQLRCRQPVGFLSGLLLNDCCKTSLERPGGNRPMHKCSTDEVKLAASRRANQTVYIGDYCSREVGTWPIKKCVERTQTYCSFDGVLSRLVQVQGRQQLANMVGSGFGQTQQVAVQFPYYSGKGGWGTPTTNNGVTLVAWQYPAYCSSPKTAADALAANPDGITCPNVLTQWFATCDKDSCGDLPFSPELGSGGWRVQQVDPLSAHTESVSQTSTISGACNTQTSQCSYQFNAWPAASQGKATITNDWSFALYSAGNTSPSMFTLGDYLFRPKALVGSAGAGNALPNSISFDYSSDYGKTWVTVDLPTKTGASGFALSGTEVVLSGDCDITSNVCKYKATGTVTAQLKPWGNAHNADCDGFSPSQLSLLNLGKMDLSEWIATIMGNIKTPDAAAIGQLANKQASDFYNAMATGGTQTTSGPIASRVASVSPNEGMGPFQARLVVIPNWPAKDGTLTDDPVSSVQVDWGDCTLSSNADYVQEVVDGKVASAFVSTHQYAAPNMLACNPAEKSVVHTVKLTVNSKSGLHYTELQVNNQWRDLSGKTVGPDVPAGGTTTPSLTTQLPPSSAPPTH